MGLDPNRPDIVTSAGHADIVQGPKGDWWAVFLACRPYQDDFYNTGRDTYLLPVTWKDGWPTILESGRVVPTVNKKAGLPVFARFFDLKEKTGIQPEAATEMNFVPKSRFTAGKLAMYRDDLCLEEYLTGL